MPADQSPKIVIVDESPIRAAILEEGLREAGYAASSISGRCITCWPGFMRWIPTSSSSISKTPAATCWNKCSRSAARCAGRSPCSSTRATPASIRASVEAGVSAYIVDGLKKERIKPILDLCISRFNAFSKLQDELDRTKSALEERKIIDRAKGIVMKLKGLTEEEAYVLLRSTAMREKKKIGEIAQSIITAAELLK